MRFTVYTSAGDLTTCLSIYEIRINRAM